MLQVWKGGQERTPASDRDKEGAADSISWEQAGRGEGGRRVGGEQMSELRGGSKWVLGRESGIGLSASEAEQVGGGLGKALRITGDPG